MTYNATPSKKRIPYLSEKDTVLLFGASGFIGSVLLQRFLEAPEGNFAQVTLATRNPTKLRLSIDQTKNRFQAVACDHINVKHMERHLPNSSVVIDLAGLAWQHPGGTPLPKVKLLKKQLVHNSISAYILSTKLLPEQRLVWTSTSAIDSMFARLSDSHKTNLEAETQLLVERIAATISLDLSPAALEKKVSELVDTFSFGFFPLEPESSKKVCFASEFSYAYSKYIGQLLLVRKPNKNIRVLKISDVYGPGQDISATILNPLLPARRIQRYLAAFLQIKNKNLQWIPKVGDMYGFTRNESDIITQKIWSDWVLPTHVADVCEIILRALDLDIPKNILEVNGHIMENSELMETLQAHCKTNVKTVTCDPLGFTMKEHSQDLMLLGMDPKHLISLDEGISDWLNVAS